MHKLILASNHEAGRVYLESQKVYIQSLYPDLDIQVVDEDNYYVTRHNKRPDRFPFMLILKHDSCKSRLNAKINNTELYNWLVVNSVK